MAELCREFGETLVIPRIYLNGQITLEHGERIISEGALPGRQGRIAFGFLAAHRHRPITRAELIDAIWRDALPPELEVALSAILSKLRATFRKLGLSSADAGIDVQAGALQLRLPGTTWVDVEAATHAVDQAEGALRRADSMAAWGHANVAVSIAARPFLMNYDAPWIDGKRAGMRVLLARGLECMARVSEQSGDHPLAIQYLRQIIELEPFRESVYQQLMRLHSQNGDDAEALRVFEHCRQLLRAELDTEPSPRTRQVLQELTGM